MQQCLDKIDSDEEIHKLDTIDTLDEYIKYMSAVLLSLTEKDLKRKNASKTTLLNVMLGMMNEVRKSRACFLWKVVFNVLLVESRFHRASCGKSFSSRISVLKLTT